jgi:hypothetical protein
MTTVKRVAPSTQHYSNGSFYYPDDWTKNGWLMQAIRDMAAGKHAQPKCECRLAGRITDCMASYNSTVEGVDWKGVACKTIAARALNFEDYEIEGEE